MQKHKTRNQILFFLISGFLIAASILGFHHYCKRESNTVHEYKFSASNNISRSGLSVGIDISKKWKDVSMHKFIPCGGQYDFVVRNAGDHDFHDWSIEFYFEQGITEDSSWNGTFEYSDNTVKFTPNDDLSVIVPGDESGFGAVYYSVGYFLPENIVLSGYFDMKPSDFTLFWALAGLFIIWAMFVIISIALRIKTHQYIKNEERDAKIIEQTMNTITSFIDAKDPYTKGHSIRVACYSKEIARRLKFDEEEIRNFYYITLMHDCGKIGIPDAILKKPGKLTPEEFEIIKTHTTIGYQILENFTAIEGIRDGAHYHHEHYDGCGYPDGLKGKDIPLLARIICVADSYDAMSSNRCYRPALPEEKIIDELNSNSGIQFDPVIVPVMLEMISDGFVKEVKEKYPSES